MSQLGKLKAIVKDYEFKLNALQKLFMSDGVIDPQEQGILSEIETLIGRINQQLSNSVAAKGHKKEPQLEIASKESVNLNEERKALAEFVVDKEDVIEDPDGNIIFTPTGGEKWLLQPGWTKDSIRVYRGVEGYIMDNDGNQIFVQLVTDPTVYKAVLDKDNILTVLVDEVLEGRVGTTNCTGLAFTKGEFVLPASEIDFTFMEVEGYTQYEDEEKLIKDVTFKGQKGDVGLYTNRDEELKETVIEHAEIFTGELTDDGWPGVDSKGGVQPKTTNTPALSTWSQWYKDEENGEPGGPANELEDGLYRMYDGSEAKNVVTNKENYKTGKLSGEGEHLSFGVMEGRKIRVVSKEDFESIQKERKEK